MVVLDLIFARFFNIYYLFFILSIFQPEIDESIDETTVDQEVWDNALTAVSDTKWSRFAPEEADTSRIVPMLDWKQWSVDFVFNSGVAL